MQKAPDPNPEGRDPELEDFADIRHMLYLCELTQFPKVREVWEELAKRRRELGLEGRDFEVWGPLLAVAKLAGENVFQAVWSYAAENIERKAVELYSEEKEVLAGLELLLLEKAEELAKGSLEMYWRELGEGGEGVEPPNEIQSVINELEKGVFFSATDLLKAMKRVLARKPDEESEKPYTEKQFEAKWSAHRIGKFLSSRFETLLPVEKKISRRLRRLTLSSFFQLAERYGYEVDERLRKLRELGNVRKTENALISRTCREVREAEAGSSNEANPHMCQPLSIKGNLGISPGEKPHVSSGRWEISPGDENIGDTLQPNSQIPFLQKSSDNPFLMENVNLSNEEEEEEESGKLLGNQGILVEPEIPLFPHGEPLTACPFLINGFCSLMQPEEWLELLKKPSAGQVPCRGGAGACPVEPFRRELERIRKR